MSEGEDHESTRADTKPGGNRIINLLRPALINERISQNESTSADQEITQPVCTSHTKGGLYCGNCGKETGEENKFDKQSCVPGHAHMKTKGRKFCIYCGKEL